ncbi:MAG: Cobalt-containing nitrile hydratase subunit beta [Frankiales bacterium]|nr:Cobalt-containing nitrile hydratase subunit beta [Frankiales bacterium]
MRFSPGDAVRTTRADPPHHSRVPRYARGAVGTVVDTGGLHPLADLRAQGLPAEPEPVYTVRFPARELFGHGEHFVTVDVWESRLEPVSGGSAGERSTQEPVQREPALVEEAR